MEPLDIDALDLTGRVAIVTGAARGIGAATARLLGAAGAAVAVCDREADDLAEVATDLGTDPVTAVLDVRDPEAVDGFVAGVADRHGRVDVLVNNAGGTFASAMVDVSPKGEGALIAENFTQVTHFVRQVEPHLGDRGAIVNVTSVEAHQAAPGYAIYAAMKAAVANLTRSLALELAPRGIRVNAVAPDAVPTWGETDTRDEMLRSPLDYEPAHRPPLGWFGDPSDVAAAVLFLASDLSRFITGTTVHVDGGTWAAGGWHRT